MSVVKLQERISNSNYSSDTNVGSMLLMIYGMVSLEEVVASKLASFLNS